MFNTSLTRLTHKWDGKAAGRESNLFVLQAAQAILASSTHNSQGSNFTLPVCESTVPDSSASNGGVHSRAETGTGNHDDLQIEVDKGTVAGLEKSALGLLELHASLAALEGKAFLLKVIPRNGGLLLLPLDQEPV